MSAWLNGFCFPYLYFLFVLFCHVLFVLFCVLLYCLMHASVCISSSEALTSLTSSQQTLIEINSFDQLVTKTYSRLRRINRWLLYFNEWSGTVLNKEKKEKKVDWSNIFVRLHRSPSQRVRTLYQVYLVVSNVALGDFWRMLDSVHGDTCSTKPLQEGKRRLWRRIAQTRRNSIKVCPWIHDLSVTRSSLRLLSIFVARDVRLTHWITTWGTQECNTRYK